MTTALPFLVLIKSPQKFIKIIGKTHFYQDNYYKLFKEQFLSIFTYPYDK